MKQDGEKLYKFPIFQKLYVNFWICINACKYSLFDRTWEGAELWTALPSVGKPWDQLTPKLS